MVLPDEKSSCTLEAETLSHGLGTDPLFVAYHDEEWGVPVHDDRLSFSSSWFLKVLRPA